MMKIPPKVPFSKQHQKPSKKSIALTTIDAYDLWSEDYDTFNNPMLAMVDEAMTIDPLELKSCNCIELGCGTGRNVERILNAGASTYVGVDQSSGMLEKAKLRYPNIKFLEADIQGELPFTASSVDFVFATLVFEHLAALTPALKEAFRVLGPNGSLRIMEIHPELSAQGTQAHFEAAGAEVTFPCYPHTVEEWRDALSEAGFRSISAKDFAVTERTLRRCAKLGKHRGRSVLLEIEAKKIV